MPRTTSSQILISMHKTKGSWKILLSLRSAIPIATIQCTIRELDAATRGNIAWGTRLSPPPIRIWPHPPTPSHGCKQSTHSKIVPVRYCRCKKLVREKLLSALKTNFTKQTISTANQLLHGDRGHVYPRTNYSIQIVSFVNKNAFSEKTTAENIDNVRPLYIVSGSLWSSSSLRPTTPFDNPHIVSVISSFDTGGRIKISSCLEREISELDWLLATLSAKLLTSTINIWVLLRYALCSDNVED